MNIYEETKFLMKKYNISANKDLGQNFLIDDNVIENIVESAEINKKDFVIEIGPGLGTLTSRLVEKAGKVIAIELDKKMLQILNDRFALYDNFSLINEDVLKVDLNNLIQQENTQNYTVKIVANLPYYITTPIVMKLLEEKLNIDSITVMVQKEVADRLTETPGGKNTGAITYCVYYYAEPKEVLTVPNTSFVPEPKVDSEVIKLNIRKEPPVDLKDEKMFFKVVKASFMQRRKTLLNGLSNSGIASKEKLKEILQELNLSENVRGESLSIEQFAKIANKLC
mgnify:CR=1 FL=1